MPTRAPLLLAAALLVTLTGCGSDEPSALPTKDSSPTASPSPTKPSGVPTTAPQAPTRLTGDVAGAKKYGEYVTALADYASSSQDLQPLLDQAQDPATCKGCHDLEEFVAGLKADDHFVVGAAPKVLRSEAQEMPGTKGTYQVVTVFDWEDKDLLKADGSAVEEKTGSQKYVNLTTAVWVAADSAWKLRTFTFQAANGGKG